MTERVLVRRELRVAIAPQASQFRQQQMICLSATSFIRITSSREGWDSHASPGIKATVFVIKQPMRFGIGCLDRGRSKRACELPAVPIEPQIAFITFCRITAARASAPGTACA